MTPHQTLSDPAQDAITTVLATAYVVKSEPAYARLLHHLLAQCDRDLAKETADELGMPVPECAREGWRAA